ncbi:MAG TPA: hypothetical protein ENF89_03370 [Candidatus Bathyarchaeota archaeon]|nr:hypothetical protein [Candidatus Bathyarchaeota archaeon]
MKDLEMKPVAEARGVEVYCPIDGWISFFNSPYPAHKSMTGVDIYPGLEYGEAAPSPIEGRLIAVRRVKAPRGRLFRDAGYDVLTLYESVENPRVVVKMLHLEPIIDVGERIGVGDELGLLLRSGYFDFWTSPHIHIEVREPSDPIRARGGHPFKRLLRPEIGDPPEELRGRVIEARPEYILLELEGRRGGLAARVDGVPILLDGGIPHYGFLGLHASTSIEGEVVRLCGKPLGRVERIFGDCALARFEGLGFRVGGHPVGLSLYLSVGSKASVKLIPERPGAIYEEAGEELEIEFSGG